MPATDSSRTSLPAAVDSDFSLLSSTVRKCLSIVPLPSSFQSSQKWQPLQDLASGLGLHGGADILAVLIIALSTCLLMIHGDREILTDRPMQTIVLGLSAVGIGVVVMHCILRGLAPKTYSNSSNDIGNYELLGGSDDVSKPNQSLSSSGPHLSASGWLGVFVLAVSAFSLRLFILPFLLRYEQCTVSGIEGASMFVVVFFRYFGPSIVLKTVRSTGASAPAIFSLARDLLPVSLIYAAYAVSSGLSSSSRSTFICPEADTIPRSTVFRQLGSTTMDSVVALGLQVLLPRSLRGGKSSPKHSAVVFGAIIIISSLVVFGLGLATYTIPRFDTFLDGLDGLYIRNIAWASSLLIIVVLSMDHLILTAGALAAILINTQRGVWNWLWASPGGDLFSAIPPIALVFLGFVVHLVVSAPRPGLGGAGRLTRSLFNLSVFLLLLFVGWRLYTWNESGGFDIHPIDDLMDAADWDHDRWTKQALTSKNLPSAAVEYRHRYGQYPPPGFDDWYRYATQRNSVVIDDFESIHEDLAPFWALSPRDLRERSKLAVSDEWNEVAEVTIRAGKANVGQVIPTHRWMVEGITKMIEPFAEHLPDMDIAFNINDEARVAIPYPELQKLQATSRAASGRNKAQSSKWSENRAESLAFNVTDVQTPLKNIFENHSFTKTMRRFGSISCPPSSLSQRFPSWDRRTFCAACAAPHSFGLFLSNWTLAASPCHQPDLSSQHGFYLSPSAYKPTHLLMPVFSQSRPGGYQDVRYPSAWNYNDKVAYAPSAEHLDPPWATKANALFWRGSTTEGFSSEGSGSWMGMARQRLVHLANNGSRPLPVLLADPKDPARFTYQTTTGPQLPDHPSLKPKDLALDVQITPQFTPCDGNSGECIARCYGTDCRAQAHEFGPTLNTSGVDFQDHWRHRFLLDADGAGFSGRFLPFLRSRSLPFKAALFREWHEPRVTAWKHFVPLDVRLQGLWSTVAYFAGEYSWMRDARKGGPKDVGERIAEAGRAWAARALRKEDMEIYLFRLLLEWGRLTDDRREELGFWME